MYPDVCAKFNVLITIFSVRSTLACIFSSGKTTKIDKVMPDDVMIEEKGMPI